MLDLSHQLNLMRQPFVVAHEQAAQSVQYRVVAGAGVREAAADEGPRGEGGAGASGRAGRAAAGRRGRTGRHLAHAAGAGAARRSEHHPVHGFPGLLTLEAAHMSCPPVCLARKNAWGYPPLSACVQLDLGYARMCRPQMARFLCCMS